MIASRFRSVGWVVLGTTAMLGCYLVTQQVAGERAQLAKIERQLLTAKRDVRRLQTEIETRARLSQIERWNREVLALTAPKPSQYVREETELAALVVAPVAIGPAAAARAEVRAASYQGDPAPAPAAPRIVPAAYIKPAGEPAAVHRIALLDEHFVDGPSGR